MVETIKICYGRKMLPISIPKKNLLAVLSLPDTPGLENVEQKIIEALNEPIGMPRLQQLLSVGKKIAIVVDDITRPTPTQVLLKPVIDQLTACGIRDSDITIIFANGTHRKHTEQEKEFLLGKEYVNRFKALDHDARDDENLIYLGTTSRGTPVRVNKFVVEADLRILTGLIKPHSYAGYSGGGKSILPGVCGMDTIIADHSYEATSHPKSILGEVEGNPLRQDIEEAVSILGPCFIVNAILNAKKEIVDIVTGDMIKAHREGIRKVNKLVAKTVPEQADIVVAGCGYPTSISFYQSTNAFSHCVRLKKPIVRKGGTIIVASPCTEGMGTEGPFYDLIKGAKSPEEVLMKLQQPGYFVQDQWVAQEYCSALTLAKLVFVSDTIKKETIENMFGKFANSVQEAIDTAIIEYGSNCKITVVPDSPNTLPMLEE